MEIKYSEAIQKIDELMKKKYPEFYKHKEYKAAITHWLHNPGFKYPFITDEVYEDLIKLFSCTESA